MMILLTLALMMNVIAFLLMGVDKRRAKRAPGAFRRRRCFW